MPTDSVNTGSAPVSVEGKIISVNAKLSVSEKIGYGLGDAGGTMRRGPGGVCTYGAAGYAWTITHAGGMVAGARGTVSLQ